MPTDDLALTAQEPLLSVPYVIAYLSMGLPAMLAGVRVVHGGLRDRA